MIRSVIAKKDVTCRRIGGIKKLHTAGKTYQVLVQETEELTPSDKKHRIHITISYNNRNGS